MHTKSATEGWDRYGQLARWNEYAVALGENLQATILLGTSSQHAEHVMRLLRVAEAFRSVDPGGQGMCVKLSVLERVTSLAERDEAWVPVRDRMARIANASVDAQYMFATR